MRIGDGDNWMDGVWYDTNLVMIPIAVLDMDIICWLLLVIPRLEGSTSRVRSAP